VFAIFYHGPRYWIGNAVTNGWQWEDLSLGIFSFLLGSAATLYHIDFFTWRDKTNKEILFLTTQLLHADHVLSEKEVSA